MSTPRSEQFKHCPESDAIIRAGYGRGTSVDQIAKKLKVSKNVVIGRARRIGLADPQNGFLARSSGHAKRWSRS